MFWVGPGRAREVFPPEPPVAIAVRPQRCAVKGAAHFGAAKRVLYCEHRCGTHHNLDGRRSGNTFLLVGLERVGFGTAGPMTAQEQTRRLITLIFAGRSRMVMIRRELPRTKYAGWVRKPFRIEREEGSPFRGPLRCHRRCCPVGQKRLLSGGFCELVLRFRFDRNGPDETQQFASDCRHDLDLFLPRAAIAL